MLYDLITRRGTRPKEDGPLYENDWWGPLTGTMKLVRVLSATGATSFGACLRRLRDRIGWSTCFAVHADISSNKPDENSGRLLEEQFLVNMQQGRCEVEGCKCETFELQRGGKSNDTITCKTCSGKHAHRPYWTYDCMFLITTSKTLNSRSRSRFSSSQGADHLDFGPERIHGRHFSV